MRAVLSVCSIFAYVDMSMLVEGSRTEFIGITPILLEMVRHFKGSPTPQSAKNI